MKKLPRSFVDFVMVEKIFAFEEEVYTFLVEGEIKEVCDLCTKYFSKNFEIKKELQYNEEQVKLYFDSNYFDKRIESYK